MRRRKAASPGRRLRPAQAAPTPNRQTPFERERTTKRRGEISELAFALAAARYGFGIAKPYGDSERYDIILDPAHLDPHARPRLVRVQVKSSINSSTASTASMPIVASTDARSPTPSMKSTSSPLTLSPRTPGSSSPYATSSAPPP